MGLNKTLAMRLLEAKKVPYELFQYDAHERDAVKIAGLLRVSPKEIFKTLVVAAPPDGRSAAKPLLVIIPADHQLDLKNLARAVGVKKLKMASHRQAEALTGLKVGGISPLALINKGFMIVLDEAASSHAKIFVSSGERGTQIRLAPADLVALTGANLVNVSLPG